MSPRKALIAALLAAPLASFGDVSFSEVRIAPDPMLPFEARQACIDNVNTLHDRRAGLDERKLDIDRAGAELLAEANQLEEERLRLDPSNFAAVQAFNARQQEHSRRTEAHNRRVAQLNDAAEDFNADAASAMRYCQGT